MTALPGTDQTVADLVTKQPARSRVFERFGIDYCCGGGHSLAEACRAKGLDLERVRQALAELEHREPEAEQIDWSRRSLTELADHIEQTHHAHLRRELPRLQNLVRKVAAVHGTEHPWLLELDGVFAAFAGELNSHMLKEEQLAFPLIRQLERGDLDADRTPSIAEPLGILESEHEEAGDALQRMRQLSDGFTPPADACASFRAMLDGLRQLEPEMHQHVHKENHVLFPAAIALDGHRTGKKETA